jgi:hypothetical protein
VNGRAAPAAEPFVLDAEDVVETRERPAAIRTAEGTPIRLAPRSVLEHCGVQGATERWLLSKGSAEGEIGPRTALGCAAATGFAPGRGRVRLSVSIPADGVSGAAEFRSLGGDLVLRADAFELLLPETCEVALAPNPGGPGSLRISAGASNRDYVELSRKAEGTSHEASLPPGCSASVSAKGGATIIVCRHAAPEGPVVVRIADAAGPLRSARLGSFASALLRGFEVALDVPALGRGRLEALGDQTAEFLPGGGEGR